METPTLPTNWLAPLSNATHDLELSKMQQESPDRFIKHFLRAWLPNLIVTGMSEQANANDNVSFERQTFLDFHELLLETGAATECDYLVVLYH